MSTNTFNNQTYSIADSWRLGVTRGDLFVQRANGERYSVREGDVISSGDTLYSRPQSAALIYGQDGRVVTLGSSSALKFDHSLFDTLKSKTTLVDTSGYSRYLSDLENLITNGGNIENLWGTPSSGRGDDSSDYSESPSSSIFDEAVVFVWERSGNELIPSISLDTSDDGQVLAVDSGFSFPTEQTLTVQRQVQTSVSVASTPAPPAEEPEENNPPSASNDTFRAYEDTDLVVDVSGGVLANDTDPDGDSLTVNTTPIVDVSNGTLTLNSDGSFTYSPTGGFTGVDQFTYELIDAEGNTSQATATITVAIEGITGSDYQWGAGLITDTAGDDLILPRGNTGASRDDISLANGGADTIAFESSDPYTSDSAVWNSTGMFRVTNFTLGDTSTNPEADALDLSDLLVTHDGVQVKMSSLTTAQQAEHILFGGGKNNYSDSVIFINIDSEYTDSAIGGSDNAEDYLNDNDASGSNLYRWGSSISAGEHATVGTDLIFEIKGVDIVNYASAESLTLNTTDFLQHLKDNGSIILD